MRRLAALAILASSATLVAGTVSTAVAASAPSDPSPPGAAPGSPPGPPEGDRDGDRVSDDFEDVLRGAAASTKLRVIVTGLRPQQARTAVGAFALRHDLPLIEGFAAQMTAAQARALSRHPGVRRVEKDGVVQALDDATDRDFGAALARRDTGLDGSGIGICVIDTGIDPAHEQVAPRPVAFRDYVNGRTAAYDDHGHGTHVASIAAGDGVGASSQAASFGGVAPRASLIGAKVLDSTGSGADSDVAAAVQWCHGREDVHVLSLSLGSPPTDGTDGVSLAVDAAVDGGDVVVVAAGNSGDAPRTVSAPGVAAGAITVGAVADHSAPSGTARRDNGIWLAGFSSRGPTLSGDTKPDIAAPGVSVTAADAGTASGYVTYSGTSMAAPYVSGAVALALDGKPTASPEEVKTALMSSAVDVGPVGTDRDWGAGLIDVRAFVDTAVGATAVDRTGFPARWHTTGTVPTGSAVEIPIEVTQEALAVPLVAMVTLTSGSHVCDLLCELGWGPGEWTPDLDAQLLAPNRAVLATSECALSGLTCGAGRQETVAILPSAAGRYVLRVYAWPEGSGAGGSFDVDVFQGPLGGETTGGGGGGPDPIANKPPTADAGQPQTVTLNRKGANFTLDGRGSSDPDGSIVSYLWSGPGLQSTSGVQVNGTLTTEGQHVYALEVTDDDGESDTDTVTVTVVKSTKGGGGGGGGKPPRG